jgi:hypothetical protein
MDRINIPNQKILIIRIKHGSEFRVHRLGFKVEG